MPVHIASIVPISILVNPWGQRNVGAVWGRFMCLSSHIESGARPNETLTFHKGLLRSRQFGEVHSPITTPAETQGLWRLWAEVFRAEDLGVLGVQ